MIDQTDSFGRAIQYFPREDGTVEYWDHPNFKSHVTLPDDFRGYMQLNRVFEMVQQGRLSEESLTLLKVIGDARCINENQIRRLMKPKQSASKTSKMLSRLRVYGLVERYKCRIMFLEDEEKVVKPPAPFTLGIPGKQLMDYLYGEFDFIDPEFWRKQHSSVQRYVAMNEIRCNLIEIGKVRQWDWSPAIGGMNKFKKPLATAKVEGPNGELQFIFERPQMSQNFVGFLRTKMEQYRYLYEEGKGLLIDGYNRTPNQIFCIYASSVSMANFLREEIHLHTYPFQVWILVGEWIEDGDISGAFATVDKTGIVRKRIPFLKKI